MKTKLIFTTLAAIAVSTLVFPSSIQTAQAKEKGSTETVVAGKWNLPKGDKSTDQYGAYIKIISPSDNSTVPAGKPLDIEYDMNPGEKGAHFHYFLDGEQLGTILPYSGKFELGKLGPGKHVISLKIANVAHILIGVETSITVIAK
ncbi:MAG: hypothetical protein ACE5EN_06230 [Nitrospinota bacterium]